MLFISGSALERHQKKQFEYLNNDSKYISGQVFIASPSRLNLMMRQADNSSLILVYISIKPNDFRNVQCPSLDHISIFECISISEFLFNFAPVPQNKNKKYYFRKVMPGHGQSDLQSSREIFTTIYQFSKLRTLATLHPRLQINQHAKSHC